MNNSKMVKRFIAGAVCPSCAALDKVVIYAQDNKQFRECVACGFLDEMRIIAQPRELTTRVNLSPDEKKAQTQVIKIVAPK